MMRTFALLSSVLSLTGQVAALSGNSSSSSNSTSPLLSSGYINLGDWHDAYTKAAAYAKGLTIAEKVSLITGVGAGDISALQFKDGSASILDYSYVTTFPAALAMAMTWDSDAIYEQTMALASEMKAKGINIANAPTGQPLGRCAWGGRSGETYGPDAYLNGILFGQATAGISAAGVVPGGKHFLFNEQETNREPSGDAKSGQSTSSNAASYQAYSAVADDKTLHETYLWPFYDSVKNGLGGVMCGMNRVNGTFSCENQALLSDYLKSELGFPGLVFGDVGGQKTGIPSANAGLDYGSSSYWSNTTINAGLNNGSLTEARLEDMVIRNVIGYYKLGQDSDYPALAEQTDFVDARKNHSKLARAYATDSIVLLKNDNNALPLNTSAAQVIAVFGRNAGSASYGPNTAMNVDGSADTFDGHMAGIGGSGQPSFSYLVTPQHALTERAIEDGNMLRFMLNDSVIASSSGRIIAADSVATAAEQITDAYAANADVCLVFINAYSGEGGDRSELRNTDQDTLVTTVASNCNNTIVIINTTGPRLVDTWIENSNVTAVLYAGALGQESGHAFADVLYGTSNPSGKLVHTIAKNESDYNVVISKDAVIPYTEGNFIDYKYFDKYNVTPRYEFGYGLSYTTFSYTTNATIATNSSALVPGFSTGARLVGGRADLWTNLATVTISISNTGSVAGSEVAQLYVSFPDAAGKPVRELRGFQKIALEAGETKEVSFPLRWRDLSVWDVQAQEWRLLNGTYGVHVGASSRDLKVEASLVV